MIIQPSTGGKAPVIPDDVYPVVCDGIDLVTLPEPDKFQKTEKLEFHLRLLDVVDEEGGEIVLDPRLNVAWSEKATLFKWAVAFGLNPNPDAPIDTDAFIGLEARAVVETEKEGAWPRVKEMMKASVRAASRQTAPAPDSEPTAIEAWWKRTRDVGLDRTSVMAKAIELFDKEPVDLSAIERARVMEALTS